MPFTLPWMISRRCRLGILSTLSTTVLKFTACASQQQHRSLETQALPSIVCHQLPYPSTFLGMLASSKKVSPYVTCNSASLVSPCAALMFPVMRKHCSIHPCSPP